MKRWASIWVIWKKYAPYQVGLLACLIFGSLIGAVPPFLTRSIVDQGIVGRNFAVIGWCVATMVVLTAVGGGVAILQGYLNTFVSERMMLDLRAKLLSALQGTSFGFFVQNRVGELLNRVIGDVDSLDSLMSVVLVNAFNNVLTIVATLIALAVLDWRLTLLSLAVMPLLAIPLKFLNKRLYEARRRSREARDKLSGHLFEVLSISSVLQTKLFGRAAYEQRVAIDLGTDVIGYELETAVIARWFLFALSLVIILGPALVWLVGGRFALVGSMSIGTLVAFVALLSRFYTPLTSLVGVQAQVVSAAAVMDRVVEFLDLPQERQTGLDLPLTGSIAVSQVTFRYPSREKPALTSVSLDISPGEYVALVGESGSGKSTLVQCMLGLTVPDAGSILYDGIPVESVSLESVRREIGLVTQDVHLSHASIRHNVAYGDPEATDDRVLLAMRQAGLHDVLRDLPQGLDTIVGERGFQLSGGQRQRVAIARVLLREPRIVIFDEATSSLDHAIERAIRASLMDAMKARTRILITHRLDTLDDVDRVIVMRDGQIVESGSYRRLTVPGTELSRLRASTSVG